MFPFHRWSAPALLAAALAGLLALPSCGNQSPTEPVPAVTVHRTVTVVVRNAVGTPVAGAEVSWTAQFDSAGLVEVILDESDADGECRQVLAQGGWIVTASLASKVSGASFVVSGSQRAPADTQVVRLTMHDPSIVTGTVILAARTDHSGTLVTGDAGGTTFTNAAGAWALTGVPRGRWSLTMYHFGFQVGLAQAVVTTPGSNVVVPAVNLVSEP